MNGPTTTARDFSSISPSAKWILLMKGHTDIPYAKEAATLVEAPRSFVPNYENGDRNFWGRTLHFESRYRSIDLLIQDQPVNNILELSSGFSFRGLDLVQREEVHYIDTDLPDVTAQKRKLVEVLQANLPQPKGKLELASLNALDEAAFMETCNRFSSDPVAIVNEGLLMYLNDEEKAKLCANIRKVLKARGGFWVTADIYLKLKPRNIELTVEPEMQQFFEQQRVEENRFDSFEAAEEFFRKQGFVVDNEAVIDFTKMTALQPLLKTIPKEMQNGKMEKIHTTWRLRLAEQQLVSGNEQKAIYEE